MKYLLLQVAVLSFLFGCRQTKKDKAGLYTAGFTIIRAFDKSRIYKPGTDQRDYLHFRPLDIDMWYPARPAAIDSAFLFRDILGLLEKRANYYAASAAANGITRQIAQSLCTAFKCSDTSRLLNFKSKSYPGTVAVAGKFPLVIYLCAYNGMSFENFTLFEELARDGLVVVSISSIGRFPGDMTMKEEDLLEQVQDAMASLPVLKQYPNIDFSKIGIVGYSWGGLAGALLAAKIPNVACLVSLDGSEFHHYGEAKEDMDFDKTRYSPEFKKMQLSIPYLRLQSPLPAVAAKSDTVYNFAEKLTGKKMIFSIASAQHEDFSCLPVVARQSGNCKNNFSFHTISTFTRSFLSDHLKNTSLFPRVIKKKKSMISVHFKL